MLCPWGHYCGSELDVALVGPVTKHSHVFTVGFGWQIPTHF